MDPENDLESLLDSLCRVTDSATWPPAPEGVKLVYPDGREMPLECVYVGLVDGTHTWQPTSLPLDDLIAGVATVTIDKLPGRTTVRLGLWPGPQDG